MNRQVTDLKYLWFRNLRKGLLSGIYKEHLLINVIRTDDSTKRVKLLKKYFSKGDLKMINKLKHEKKCLTSLITRKMQIKIEIIYHFTLL